MCFYDQVVWSCGAWRWTKFRDQCNKVYRIGETCGLKLCYDTTREGKPCKLCEALSIKHRKIDKMETDIQRWLSEGDRPATVEKGREVLAVLERQATKLRKRHNTAQPLRIEIGVRKARLSSMSGKCSGT